MCAPLLDMAAEDDCIEQGPLLQQEKAPPGTSEPDCDQAYLDLSMTYACLVHANGAVVARVLQHVQVEGVRGGSVVRGHGVGTGFIY